MITNFHLSLNMYCLSDSEKLDNERDSFRKSGKAPIIQKTRTLEPQGINKRMTIICRM